MRNLYAFIILVLIHEICCSDGLHFLSRKTTKNLPPGRLGVPLISDKTLPFTKRGSQYLEEQHIEYGPIYKQRLFFTKAIVVTGYDNLKQLWLGEHEIVEAEVPGPFAPLLGEKGIFMTKGTSHKKLKQQISKAFNPQAINLYLSRIQSVVENYFETIISSSSNNSVLYGVTLSKQLSFNLILEIVMGIDSVSLSPQLAPLYKIVQSAMFAPPINFPGSTFRKALKARKEILDILDTTIQSLTSNISMKLSSSSIETEAKSVLEVLLKSTDKNGNKLDIDQIKDICFNMLDAGQETTAYTMSSLLSSLARYPSILNYLRQEQSYLIHKYNTTIITPLILQEMTFADAVIKETLRNASPDPSDRMRSITVIGIKKALKTFQLGNYTIPKGYTIITNSAYMHHHDPRWESILSNITNLIPLPYNNNSSHNTSHLNHQEYIGNTDDITSTQVTKTSFCPMRWLTEAGKQSGEFLPFATGPRACIGMYLHVAIAELKIILAILARSYEWKLIDPESSNTWKSDPFPYPLDNLPLHLSRL